MARDERDFIVELSSAASRDATPDASPRSSNVGRPFLSVHFACCGVYQRIYKSNDGKSYTGRCPRCGLPVQFAVGPGGTSSRTFVVH